MAHRANVIQVLEKIETRKKEDVTDPSCKKKLSPKDSKYSVFHHDKTYYFCSKDCKNKFVTDFMRSGVL